VAQSPGLIVRPAGGPYSAVLDTNQNGYTSSSTSGFVLSDITESELLYKVVPPAITEPTGDLATGPSGGFTDIVRTVDNSGFYVYSNGVNIHFRLRIGGIISGSKGYSILIDTDGKMGNSGPHADPDYVAPTNTGKGNPGFEYEVVYETNFRVQVYNINGSGNPVPSSSYPLNTHSQISVALSRDGNNPDSFYDWYVPLSAIGSPSSIRMAATTVTSPGSALQGSRSDIYGINDATSGVEDAWQAVVNAQPPISITPGGIGNVNAICTAPPTLNVPVSVGSTISVTGLWTRMDASKPSTATIILYRNNITLDSILTTSGNTWTIVVPAVANGEVFYARARAAGESECLQSASATAASCVILPALPVITCASQKGITANIELNSTILLYQVSSATGDPAAAPITTNITYPTTTTFAYYNNNCSGSGSPLTSTVTYMVKTVSAGGCVSGATMICIQGSASVNVLPANTIAITTPVYPFQTSISGANATTGQLLRLFINDIYIASQSASGSTFTFSGLTLKANDQLKIYSQGTGCMTVSNTFAVNCYNPPPTISTDATGKLLSTATTITGTSIANANITLNRISTTTASWTTTANTTGSWTVSGLTLTAGDVYNATITSASSCSTPGQASSSASVAAPTTVCPTITGSYTENNTAVTGSITTSSTGVVRLYLDDVLEGSFTISGTGTTTWTISPLNYPLYNGGILKASFQAGTNAENLSCATTTVTCTSPNLPSITPTSSTIAIGQSVTYSVSNVVSNTWYAIMDNTGSSYATSLYTNNTSSFPLTTRVFNTAGTYNVSLSADKLTGCPSSFTSASVVVNAIGLPVKFTRVAANKLNGDIEINWDVTGEANVNYYAVERSYNCIDFEWIADLSYKNSSSSINQYSFTDKSFQNTGKICYRIKQVDDNKNFTYSNIVSVKTEPNRAMMVWPNPAENQVFIGLNSTDAKTAKVELYDVRGRKILFKKISLQPGANTFNLNNLARFQKGIYLLKVVAGKQMYQHQLLLK